MISESLRLPCKYDNTRFGGKRHMLIVTREEDSITLELTRQDERMAVVYLPAWQVADEITPSSTGYLWTVWVDDIAVRVDGGDKAAIERMVQRALDGAPPAL